MNTSPSFKGTKLPAVSVASFCRTPVARAGRELSAVPAVQLAAVAGKRAIVLSGLSDRITCAVYGSSRLAGQGVNPARVFSLNSGLGEEIPAFTVSCACSSGIEALLCAWRMIALGEADAVLVGAAENMSSTPRALVPNWPDENSFRYVDLASHDGLTCSVCGMTMPETAESLARELGITRTACEEFAARSHSNYLKHRQFHEADLVEVHSASGTLARDTLPRTNGQLAGMPKLRPIFGDDGVLTAATASSLADGGAAAVICRTELAPSSPVLIAHSKSAIDPPHAPIAPIFAVRALLAALDKGIEDIGHFELNEGFAPQAIACIKELGLPAEKVNPFGGALAIGHPTGMTPLRIAGLACRAIREGHSHNSVVTVPVSGGIGVALYIETPQ
ncbi:MAG: thiolase family protein [Planctomycetota bacterium]